MRIYLLFYILSAFQKLCGILPTWRGALCGVSPDRCLCIGLHIVVAVPCAAWCPTWRGALCGVPPDRCFCIGLLEKAALACCGAASALKMAVLTCSGAARMRLKSVFKPASVPPVRSKTLFEPAVRDHYSKVLVSVSLCSEPLHSALLYSVHGYARVHTSIYIYIYI